MWRYCEQGTNLRSPYNNGHSQPARLLKFSRTLFRLSSSQYIPNYTSTGWFISVLLNTVILPTPCSRVLLENLPVSQLVKIFPTFYGTRKFIIAFTSARHLSLSWARSIQSMPTHPISWRPTLILSSHLRLGLPADPFPSGFPTKTLHTPLLSPTHVTYPTHLFLLDFIYSRNFLFDIYIHWTSHVKVFLAISWTSIGGVEHSSTHSLPQHQMRWAINFTPLSLRPRERTPVPTEQKAGWPHSRFWQCSETRTAQPVTSGYTDCTRNMMLSEYCLINYRMYCD